MAKTVLVVDDSASVLMIMRVTLELNNFVMETAPDGSAALGKLQAGLLPDLIITDINMPKMDGFSLIEAIKAMPALKRVPVLTMTTESSPERREKVRRLGATGWIVKPITTEKLLSVLKKVLPE